MADPPPAIRSSLAAANTTPLTTPKRTGWRESSGDVTFYSNGKPGPVIKTQPPEDTHFFAGSAGEPQGGSLKVKMDASGITDADIQKLIEFGRRHNG